MAGAIQKTSDRSAPFRPGPITAADDEMVATPHADGGRGEGGGSGAGVDYRVVILSLIWPMVALQNLSVWRTRLALEPGSGREREPVNGGYDDLAPSPAAAGRNWEAYLGATTTRVH
jgi:hypothetical protein